LHLTLIHLHKIIKTLNIPSKLAGRIGTLRGLDLARGPDFGERWYTRQVFTKHFQDVHAKCLQNISRISNEICIIFLVKAELSFSRVFIETRTGTRCFLLIFAMIFLQNTATQVFSYSHYTLFKNQ